MNKLISEQIPNDGGYHIKWLVDEANGRLKQIGKQGKRATIVAKKTSLSLQFSFKDGNGRPQKNVGLGAISVSPNGILEAEKLAQMVTNQLVANQFTWDWFNALIGKDTSEQNKQLTCKEMVEQYKKHYFKQRKDNKNVKQSWYARCQAIEDVIGEIDKPLTLSLLKQIIETKENNTNARKVVIQGLIGLLKYFDNSDYKNVIKEYKAHNKPKSKKRNVPSDPRIIEVFQKGFDIPKVGNKKYDYRFTQWRFLFGLLATYGLRVHEAWNIANWDKAAMFKDNDWIALDADDDNSIDLLRDTGNIVIPAILDPNNKEYLLCIKHNTKTGYRVTSPLSPEGHNWIKEFNLLQSFNLPDIENPLERSNKGRGSHNCTRGACQWFRTHEYGFTPHDLRHAYNHRGHRLGFNPKALADSLGHSVTMNSTGYLRHMSNNVKLQGIKDAINKEQTKRSKLEELELENKALKAENTALKNQIQLLETKLQLQQYLQTK